MNIENLYAMYLRSQTVSTDTRNIPMKSIFFALKGNNFNGNKFAKQAIESGALFAIVDEKEYADESEDIHYVEDTLNALQKLAEFHREKLTIPIIALTGSNGKTTTKELITAVLSKRYNVASTIGNLNNHIGVPLTLLSIHPNHEIAIVEMGANHQMEIDFLSKIAKPDFGYITNFGKAHLEGFGGEEGVIKGKSELYDYLKKNEKTVFVNCDDKKQVELTEGIRKITFGSDPKAEFSFKFSKSINGDCPEIIYDSTHFKSQLTGDYNQSNVAAAIAIGLKFEVPIEDIKAAIEEYIPDNNRSQIIHQNDLKIILDAYNANPSSMQAALLNFSKMKGDKAIILGDMFELGDAAAKEHQAIIDLAEKLEFQTIFLIGKFFHQIAVNYKNIRSFENRETAEKYFSENPIQEKQLLIKGSRGMALEKLLEIFSS
ncbi:UDP-N-acetylmuramoyl-tripeptide--D-alanyl-D-alanine ligase [Moheibacter lacus]|uniref:UDP-N-acetylmuramoyl-tripeptide--D-alanyl-D-alanine ligase n=1 Tax=Moheibacter lacus TaxID=2745851 RepID=A0A838ZFJ2_9FLAO|nr:UDP-N-acetylmuramoyl-tripeptide--D-alanyl-D-alanine ligase [Moheibacter lacus]MBA5628501.1 UDP-N-acetylmuramoyl-tripeptide--D-alanyl-D-alanine ligase [Moheibacter lacus]